MSAAVFDPLILQVPTLPVVGQIDEGITSTSELPTPQDEKTELQGRSTTLLSRCVSSSSSQLNNSLSNFKDE
ncbi:hypothetical protein LWI28_011505 [Acer negundo]|uniref:Uncharacterized protein n=1 Tax=Acer negundo TaxID=4023 RepID=A0AAD5I976_ACENE|nr:hypothetical protein LWI28_011505 [Acer negundo]